MLKFSQFKVLTFDCYGTLIDWEQGIVQALRPLLQKYGVVLPDDKILEHYAMFESQAEKGEFRSYREILQVVLGKFGDALDFAPTNQELAAFPDSIQKWPPFPDTVAALQKLAQNYRLAIISNIDDDLFAHSAAQLGVRFDWVVTAQQVGAYKPSLQNFEYAFKKIAMPKKQILHVAQSLYHDHVPAKKLGLNSVWVNRRQGHKGSGATPPAEATPDLEVPDMRTLVELIEKANA